MAPALSKVVLRRSDAVLDLQNQGGGKNHVHHTHRPEVEVQVTAREQWA